MSSPTIRWTAIDQEALDQFLATAADIHIERMTPNAWSIVVHTDGQRYDLHVSASASVDVLLEAEPDRRTSVAEQHLKLFHSSRAVEEERLRGLDPTQISEALGIPRPEVDRTLADLARWGGEKPVTPTIFIYRRWLDEIEPLDEDALTAPAASSRHLCGMTALDEVCLVRTNPRIGLTDRHVDRLLTWAEGARDE